ncbi:hypothetical protein [Simkania sp.]|uniref:hypothetical protein n=1 Tax=Simkania sp. TaxID=34094 RepID=UPI003B519CB9
MPGISAIHSTKSTFQYREHPRHKGATLVVERALDESLKRSPDPIDRARFFDTRSMTIQTKEDEKLSTIYVSGPGRKERLTVLRDGSFPPTIKDHGVLTMDGTLKPANMYLLEALSQSEVLPQEAEYSMGVIRQYDDPAKNQIAKDQIQRILSEALSQAPVPEKISARLLTNDGHWQLVEIDLTEGLANPRLTIINSTNMTRSLDIPSIQESYYQIIGQTISESLVEAGGAPVSKEKIRYLQGLQYGNMGCGIAADLNFKKVRSGEISDAHIFKKEDIVSEEIEETLILGEGDVHTFRTTRIDTTASIDRSVRITRFDETLRRVDLFNILSEKSELKKELLGAIRS